MAACPRELQQELLIISKYYPLSLAGFDLPSALPRSARSVFLREVVDPAVMQYMMVTSAQLTYYIC